MKAPGRSFSSVPPILASKFRFGTEAPAADAEVISLRLGIIPSAENQNLQLKSIVLVVLNAGHDINKLCRTFFRPHLISSVLLAKIALNEIPAYFRLQEPLFARKSAMGGPLIYDFLCEECSEHFAQVQRFSASRQHWILNLIPIW